jgi:hypothetical protein
MIEEQSFAPLGLTRESVKVREGSPASGTVSKEIAMTYLNFGCLP